MVHLMNKLILVSTRRLIIKLYTYEWIHVSSGVS